ncbi:MULTISPECIES: pantoate kinase [unclassified Methanoregula]|uniref:pantoate kinase n=1 Tax=unclassified Methanoregula TaxID=2649730 RepID=UPI0009D2AA83|nr:MULTISPECIES: pantoate kinase [unclassified Methanoregula]OPX65183.1 MAG: Pantoate kinase [Methanoregula sp. PtaB.Bin085]OPY32092.1 MAG: Pantoate kinase [Methanoregula sp. PtaU1.Bin006]
MNSRTVTAFCPGHISGYFRRIGGATPAATGSIGAGIVISEGVTASVTQADSTSVIVNRTDGSGNRVKYSTSSPPLEYVLEKLGVTVEVTTGCTLPIGAGFGLSAAALLATITAANRACNLGLTPHDIARLAHEAEVIHRTGLGDVAACQAGGRVVRDGPGIDGSISRFFDLPGPLCAVSFGPISTPSVLGSQEQMERVAAAFPPTRPYDAADFFRLSLRFAEQSGLLTPEARVVIRECTESRIPASMTMLGNGVFAYGKNAREILAAHGRVYTFSVANEGARITGEGP